jgi:hypothetical protein
MLSLYRIQICIYIYIRDISGLYVHYISCVQRMHKNVVEYVHNHHHTTFRMPEFYVLPVIVNISRARYVTSIFHVGKSVS